MVSVEGEVVPLKKRIKPSEAGGAVEKWLVQVCVRGGGAGALGQAPSLSRFCSHPMTALG